MTLIIIHLFALNLLHAATSFRVKSKISIISSAFRGAISMISTQQTYYVTPQGLNVELLSLPGREDVIDDPEKSENNWMYSMYDQIAKAFPKNEKVEINRKPPLLFLHGSFHSAWCWSENFFEYFSNIGYNCYASSLRGTSNTGVLPGTSPPSISVEDHIYDVSNTIKHIRDIDPSQLPPILISHSFGGLISMIMLESEEIRESLSGAVFLCSVPPSGNGPMTSRYITKRFFDAVKITYGFVFKALATDEFLCAELLFDQDTPIEDIKRYMKRFREDSAIGLDVFSVNKLLPSKNINPATGAASWIERAASVSHRNSLLKETSMHPSQAAPSSFPSSSLLMSSPSSTSSNFSWAFNTSYGNMNTTSDRNPSVLGASTNPNYKYNGTYKAFNTTSRFSNNVQNERRTDPSGTLLGHRLFPRSVIGAECDFIVDLEGTKETARYLNVTPVILPECAHEVMLGPRWRLAADAIASFLNQTMDAERSGRAVATRNSTLEVTENEKGSLSVVDAAVSYLSKWSRREENENGQSSQRERGGQGESQDNAPTESITEKARDVSTASLDWNLNIISAAASFPVSWWTQLSSWVHDSVSSKAEQRQKGPEGGGVATESLEDSVKGA